MVTVAQNGKLTSTNVKMRDNGVQTLSDVKCNNCLQCEAGVLRVQVI